MDRHAEHLKVAQAGGFTVAFLGDSITEGWLGAGKPVWEELDKNYHVANFGIGGDRTQHVLWRLDHGLL
ncbi:MAG TPA: hypothetical protein VG711_08235, partial [Phycisphaerales bacterium]|nr:hypothetical protein [Phycisphaerales bacterium]